MSAINELRETLEHTQTASFVTTMLRDISATKLQSIRAEFDANHAYFLELHELMELVETYSQKYLARQGTTETKKRVYIALTSNKRFYGTLNHQIIHALNEVSSKNNEADCIVIGQTGRQILEASELTLKPQYIYFETDDPTPAEIFSCIQRLVSYSEIMVIHPTFINSFDQHATITDLTHKLQKKESEKKHVAIDYLFEPEIPKMIAFFKTQIRLVLFNRIVLETKLAFTGARLMKMQRARERARELLKQQRRVIHKEISTVQSMRLLEAFAGFRSKDTV
jgi:ATP synthase F1 gamma subunit